MFVKIIYRHFVFNQEKYQVCKFRIYRHFVKSVNGSNFPVLVPQATLHLIYQALIQPHFDYCNIVWGNCGITLMNKIQKLQNRAARALTNSNYDADTGHLFELLGWKNLASQQHIQRARHNGL